MSFAMPCVTSFMIIMQRANIEYRLMMITNQLQQLSRESANELGKLQTEWLNNAKNFEGADDEADVALATTEFNLAYQNISSQIKAKEDALEMEKIQLENQLEEYKTMEDGVNQMIKDGAKDLAIFR